jgi:acetyltransferase-like isoleucine patch superfamily enzyme
MIYEFLFRLYGFIELRRNEFMDRVYTQALSAKLQKCGRNVQLHYPLFISNPESVQIGSNVHINRDAFIRSSGGLTIGDNTHIARNVVIYTVNHNYAGSRLPYDDTAIKKPVEIGKNVWIGINVTIVPGVKIGEGAIIGAGTVVATDVPPLAIVGSAPLRILKFRDEQHYRELEEMQQYGGPSGKLYKRE